MAFQKGTSGNKSGRPKGSKDKRSELRELFKPHAPALCKVAIDMALGGNEAALRLCIDHLIPRLKPTSEPVQLDIDMSGEPVDQGKAVLKAAMDGDLSIENCTQLLQGIAAQMRILEITELEKRIDALESQPPTRRH